MAVHHVTVTLGAGITAISTPAVGSPSINCREIQIENETGNADVKVGDVNLTTTNYGRAVTAGAANALTLRVTGNNINLASTYLLGTQSQKVHVLYLQ